MNLELSTIYYQFIIQFDDTQIWKPTLFQVNICLRRQSFILPHYTPPFYANSAHVFLQVLFIQDFLQRLFLLLKLRAATSEQAYLSKGTGKVFPSGASVVAHSSPDGQINPQVSGQCFFATFHVHLLLIFPPTYLHALLGSAKNEPAVSSAFLSPQVFGQYAT